MKVLQTICMSFFLITSVISQGHYPLEVGNKWEYRDRFDGSYQYTIEVIGDTIMTNGIKYNKLWSAGGSVAPFSQYYRQTGSKVFGFLPQLGNEFLWCDFTKTVGDTITINYYGEDTVIVTVIYDQISEVFGKQRRQWGFYEEYKNSYLDGIYVVTDSIGLTFVQATEASLFNYLSGAIIDGVQYGNVTSVKPEKITETKDFTINQNYPNPFNPTTTISYTLPEKSFVTLKVYDILGREVATLVSSIKEAGVHKASFNSSNLPSGVYIYSIQAGTYNVVKKMILVK